MILEALINFSSFFFHTIALFFIFSTIALLQLDFLVGIAQLYYKILTQRKADQLGRQTSREAVGLI